MGKVRKGNKPKLSTALPLSYIVHVSTVEFDRTYLFTRARFALGKLTSLEEAS